mmetsp:Transcript_26843/g.62752  ORF Transcript_26843/g.62752 Transcript_26843/m.62752 type:complete len:96 (-) Transcript_26843:205-492(-)|eukprot:CAMPEP_0172389756 /NCGR_PEP_ID=MMETSP1061-20121228/6572_1 /TAXON_ID=37318 /ORGANISM="Pseudo-nitzschia pungens, Strain cf. pungens" /LENGTH=95 /DNA_ID=CAMNT_0013119975 /DNA_START=116 /DNA_END=403 /DNA_ORIENTATION=+
MGCSSSKAAAAEETTSTTKKKMGSELVLDKYEDYDWDELPKDIQELCAILGYTKKLWDKDKEPEAMDEDWADLTDEQKAAAEKLGYTETTWDEEE